jgi:hypothetical protein
MWTLSKIDEHRLSLFERKVLRCIVGAKQGKCVWRKRYNHELYKTFNEPDVVNYIKVKILAWAGHVTRMDNNVVLKKNWKNVAFQTDEGTQILKKDRAH